MADTPVSLDRCLPRKVRLCPLLGASLRPYEPSASPTITGSGVSMCRQGARILAFIKAWSEGGVIVDAETVGMLDAGGRARAIKAGSKSCQS